jgi:hypothetical protein
MPRLDCGGVSRRDGLFEARLWEQRRGSGFVEIAVTRGLSRRLSP